MRAVRVVLITLAAAILLVVAASAILLAVLNHDGGRLASYLLERASGRAVEVDGRFALQPSLRPSLVMSQVRIANPPWASGPDLARIGHLELQIPLWPLLSGTLVLERLIVNDATLALERSADGAANWTVGDGGPGLGLVPVFGTVRMRNVAWNYHNDATGQKTSAQLARLTLQDTGGKGQLDARGVWGGQAIAATGTLGTLAQALDPVSPFPLDLAVKLPGLDLGARGTITEPAAGRGLDLKLTGRSDDIARFLQVLGRDHQLTGPLEGEATLGGDFDAVRLADLRLSVGGGEQQPELRLNGSIATVRPGEALLLEGIALQAQGTTSTAALASWLGRPLPDLGPVAAQLTVSGTSEALKVSGLRIDAGGKDGPTLGARGDIEEIRLAPAFSGRDADLELEGIALDLQGTTSTAALASWLGRPLPDLGPVVGQLTLSGTSETLKVSGLRIDAGAKDGPTLGARGDIGEIRLAPAFSVQDADLQLEAAAPDLAALGAPLDVALPRRPFSYSGRLSGDADEWTLAGDVRLGDTAITQTFTGRVAGPPAGLAGELSVALAGIEATVRGNVADLAKGQGLDLHLVGHAEDAARLLSLLGYRARLHGRLSAEATIAGDLARLHVADLHLGLNQGPGPRSRTALQATGQVARVTPGGATLLDGIALQVQGATSTAALADWLGRPLPDLGPVQGRFRLSGSSRALRVTTLNLRAGAADRLHIAATGGVREVRLAPGFRARGFDLSLDARARDGAALGKLLDADLSGLGALAYAGRLTGDAASWAAAGRMQIGETVIDEDLAGSHDGPRPRISGKLSVPTLHLADFGVAADAAPLGPHPPPPASSGPWLAPDALRALGAVDLELRIDVGEVEGSSLAISQGEVHLALEDGVLRVDPARFRFVAGTALVQATADARREPPRIDLDLQADDVRLGDLLTAIGRTPPITGELALNLKLEGSGDSAAQLLSSLDGEAEFALQRGGVSLGSLTLATADVMTWLIAGAERGTGLLRGMTTGGQTKLDCFAGRFAIERGVATAQALLMKTPLTLSTAKGRVNLVHQTIDLKVHLRARRDSMFDPATVYRIRGPLADPAVSFDPTRFAMRTIVGLALTPVDVLGSVLLPLVGDNGSDPDNPCLQTVG